MTHFFGKNAPPIVVIQSLAVVVRNPHINSFKQFRCNNFYNEEQHDFVYHYSLSKAIIVKIPFGQIHFQFG